MNVDELSEKRAQPRAGVRLRLPTIGEAWFVAVASWFVGFYCLVSSTMMIFVRHCGLYSAAMPATEDCDPVSLWAWGIAFGMLATPIVWIAAGAVVGRRPGPPAWVRGVALLTIPGTPLAFLLMHLIIFLRYGPPPP